MKRTIGLVATCVLLLGVSMQAQAPQAPPKPGPEVKKLAYFIGTWKDVGTAHMGSMQGPEGKMTTTTKYEWLPGGFFVVGHSDGTSSMGSSKEVSVLGWEPNTKMYTYNAFDSMGQADHAMGTVSGDTWTWKGDDIPGPSPMKVRVTIKEVSKTEYTFKMEVSKDGNTWTTGMDSTSTKVMAAAPAAK